MRYWPRPRTASSGDVFAYLVAEGPPPLPLLGSSSSSFGALDLLRDSHERLVPGALRLGEAARDDEDEDDQCRARGGDDELDGLRNVRRRGALAGRVVFVVLGHAA